MTDLRDRIAAAIMDSCHGVFVDDAVNAADAVIRELGLRPELGQRSKPTGPLWGLNNRYNVTRYVTEWSYI